MRVFQGYALQIQETHSPSFPSSMEGTVKMPNLIKVDLLPAAM
jgi:hypothetical protein